MVVQLILAAVGVGSSIKAGQAKKKDAYANAKQMEIERALNKAEALERSNFMAAEYSDSVSANEAFFAFSGRDVSDMSVKAFLDRQREVYASDQTSLSQQSTIKNAAMSAQISATRSAGRSSLVAGYLGAASEAASGLYQSGKNRSSTSVPMTGGKVNKSTTTGYKLGAK